MQLNLNFDGLTKLKDWWQVVKDNFLTIQTEVNNKVSTTDYATADTAGVIKVGDGLYVNDDGQVDVLMDNAGIIVNQIGALSTDPATEVDIQQRADEYKPITPFYLDYAVRSVIGDIIIGDVTVDGQTIKDIISTKLQAYYDKSTVDNKLLQKANTQTVNRYKQELDNDISDTNADLSELTQRVNSYLSPFSFGIYTEGDRTERVINLGYRPKAVLVVSSWGGMSIDRMYGGLALDGYPAVSTADGGAGKIEISDNGFKVSGYCNNGNISYYYIAIKSDSEIVVH